MSTSMLGNVWAAEAGADLSTSLFLFAAMDTDGTIIVGTTSNAPFGVIVEAALEGSPVSVQYDGVAKVKLGASLDPGVRVQSNALGEAVAFTSGVASVGIILKGGVSGDIVPVVLGI